ncbi:MAG: hypothetical protein P4N24_07380, partial [Acidobacteriota bacterium]|nr:hypothetical protein [Acidobacteriota bacterium]
DCADSREIKSVRTEDWPEDAGAEQTNINVTPKRTASLFRISALLLFALLLSYHRIGLSIVT